MYAWILPIYLLVFFSAGLFLVYYGYTRGDDIAVYVAAPIFFGTAVFCGLVFARPFYTHFTFTADGVRIKIPFKKATVKPYKEFPYVHMAAYRHSGPGGALGTWRKFIVFTNRRLRDWEEYEINNVSCDENLIKVKYSEKTCQKLSAILPQYHRTRLQSEAARPMLFELPEPAHHKRQKKKPKKHRRHNQRRRK